MTSPIRIKLNLAGGFFSREILLRVGTGRALENAQAKKIGSRGARCEFYGCFVETPKWKKQEHMATLLFYSEGVWQGWVVAFVLMTSLSRFYPLRQRRGHAFLQLLGEQTFPHQSREPPNNRKLRGMNSKRILVIAGSDSSGGAYVHLGSCLEVETRSSSWRHCGLSDFCCVVASRPTRK